MCENLYHFQTTVTLLGAGPVSVSLMNRAASLAPLIVAADGGAGWALVHKHRIHAIIGDLDSVDITENWQNSGIFVHRITEQDTTDFEKCLYSIEAPLFLAAGFLGGRTDHTLAAANALLRFANKRVILLGETDLTFLAVPDLRLDLPEATQVSLTPLVPATGVVSRGLRWNVAGLRLAPGGRMGVSNEATGGRVHLQFDTPGILVTLPLDHLEAAVAAVTR